MPLAPPRPRDFATYDDLYRTVQTHAKAEGYCINPQTKRAIRDTVTRWELRCDRSGKYKPSGQRRVADEGKRRHQMSKKTDCPFHAVALWDPINSVWHLRIDHPSHNHPPSESPGAHPRHRAEERETQRPIVEEGINKGLTSTEIYAMVLQHHPNTIVESTDIINMVHAIRRERHAAVGEAPLPPGKPKAKPKPADMPNPPPPTLNPNAMLLMAAEIKKAKDEIRRLKDALGIRDRKLEMLEWERVVFEQRFARLESAVFPAQNPPGQQPPGQQQPGQQPQQQHQQFPRPGMFNGYNGAPGQPAFRPPPPPPQRSTAQQAIEIMASSSEEEDDEEEEEENSEEEEDEE